MRKHGFRDIENEKEMVSSFINCLQNICKLKYFIARKCILTSYKNWML